MKLSVAFLTLFFILGINFSQAQPSTILPPTVTIDLPDGEGSGTAILYRDPFTYILTCDHVVKEQTSITVTREGQPDLPAKVVLESSKLDLALLQVKGPLPLAQVLGSTDLAPMEGEAEIIAGSPFELGVMLTPGFIGPKQDNGAIMGSATAWPGNSGGGAYVDRNGWKLAGVVQAILQISMGGDEAQPEKHDKNPLHLQSIGQISFFIPMSVVREFLKGFHG